MEGIFQAISECQTLYPDVEQMNSSDEEVDDTPVEDGGEPGEGDFFTTPEGLQHLTPEGQRVLEHLESVFQMPTPEEFDQMVSNGECHQNDLEGSHIPSGSTYYIQYVVLVLYDIV